MPDGVSAIRALAAIPVALLASACWTPGPGEMDPTRYPWGQPRLKPSYCIVSLEQPGATGITIGQPPDTLDLKCNPPANRQMPAG